MYLITATAAFTITLITSLAASPALILTPLITQNRTEEARNASLVNPDLFLNVRSHSGFLTVDERYDSNLFFWYFPVSNENLTTTPWIIWLQGGPGATSLAGLFVEMGPFEYNNDGLKKREFSWSHEYSMVFIDNPVGAGFSFTNSDEGFARSMEMYTNNLYTAVKQLTRLYPELGEAPLYVAGESYGGRYVPALATKISEGRGIDNSINLQGIILGNPVLDRGSVTDYTRVFYNWGLVDAQGALGAKPLQEKYEEAIRNGDVTSAYRLRDEVLDKLQEISYKAELYNVLHHSEGLMNFVPFVTRSDIKEALHAGGRVFTFSNHTAAKKLVPDFLSPVSPMIDALLERYKVLIYCGQLDLTTPCVLNAEARRKNWRWSGRDQFLGAPRVPWWFNNTVAGYVKSGGNFTEILVKGAGHLVPADKPAQAAELIYNFIQSLNFPPPPDYKINRDIPNYQEYTDLKTSEILSRNWSAGYITSVVVNVMLLAGIVVGVVMFMRWKKRQNDYFNLPLSDDILTFS